MVQVWAGVGVGAPYLVGINSFAKSMIDCRGRKMGYVTQRG